MQISTKDLKRAVKISEYSFWVIAIFVIGFIATTELGVNPLFPKAHAETDEEFTEEKFQNFIEYLDAMLEFHEKVEAFSERWDDRFNSRCEIVLDFIPIMTDFLIKQEQLGFDLFEKEKGMLLLEWIGVTYLLDCTSYEYHQNHNMMDLVMRYHDIKGEYEFKYGEVE